MWLTRLLFLFMAEYGGLILSLISPVIAYLLHFHRDTTTEKEKPTFKDVWLQQWVNFRERLKERGSIWRQIIIAATLITALGLTPLINRIFAEIGNIWEQTAVAYPYRTVRFSACVLLFLVALVLFWMRRRFPRGYAFLEISVGLWMAWDALSFMQEPDSPIEMSAHISAGINIPNTLRIMAAVYVIIRGLVNWNDRSHHPLVERLDKTADAELNTAPA
jgi:hypothetical protein